MDLRELKYIKAIGETHNMSRAAESLFISQPALFKTLKKVEAEVNHALFYKQGHDLLPTDIGQIVLKYADIVDNDLQMMQDEIYHLQNREGGKVRIGFPSIVGTMYLPDPLTVFFRKYPDIEVNTMERGGSALRKEVEEGHLDMAIVMRNVTTPSLNELPIVNDSISLCVPKDHPLAMRPFVTFSDLKDVPFITFDSTFDIHQYILDRFQAENVRPLLARTGASCPFLYQMAKASSTALILPRPMLQYYNDGSYVDVPFSPVFPWGLCLIYRKDEYLSIAAKTMLLFLQTYFLNEASLMEL